MRLKSIFGDIIKTREFSSCCLYSIDEKRLQIMKTAPLPAQIFEAGPFKEARQMTEELQSPGKWLCVCMYGADGIFRMPV